MPTRFNPEATDQIPYGNISGDMHVLGGRLRHIPKSRPSAPQFLGFKEVSQAIAKCISIRAGSVHEIRNGERSCSDIKVFCAGTHALHSFGALSRCRLFAHSVSHYMTYYVEEHALSFLFRRCNR